VDQSESHLPETEKYLKAEVDRRRLTWMRHSPPSLTAARNRALCETTSDIIIFIDDDILTHTDFIKAHMENYFFPNIDAVSGPLLNKTEAVTKELPPNIDLANPASVDLKLPQNFSRRLEVPLIRGANFSIRRRVFRQLGGFNEYLPTFGEDTDLAFRLWENGFKIVFDPKAWLVHLRDPSGGCRLAGKFNWQDEWRKVAGYPYLAFRYGGNWHSLYFLLFMWLTLRLTVLFKRNLKSPLRWGRSVLIYLAAMSHAYRWAKLREPLITVK
jgi:GT2 family glycosyltransferase